ncbi:hypothetical protein Y032_0257g417 [Ancylostoma ceylanicum]|uniref:Uncharacterized protein n=1 Tax=Ancylostoma ceylanicum TaxID=53326 RepID=A0A016SBR6_9BILA|nr:hypothetical protein Y032_0257g417 [Ancylostoma ceylanicum]
MLHRPSAEPRSVHRRAVYVYITYISCYHVFHMCTYTRGRPDSVVVSSLTPPRSRSAPPQQHGLIAVIHRL